MSNYILPKIRNSSRYEDLSENTMLTSDVDYIENLESICSLHRSCVVAEPGYGKSRLLSEIYDIGIKQGKISLLIDLKKVDSPIEVFIKNKGSRRRSKDSFEVKGLRKCENFTLKNSEDVIVCLDALDEVQNNKFNKVLNWILEFANDYSNIRIIVSCRTAFIVNKQNLFEDANFTFLSIEKFSEKEIEKYFRQNNIEEEIVAKILKLMNSDKDMCIRVPRHLEMTTRLLNDDRNVNSLTKSDLFEKIIYENLNMEDNTLEHEQRDITKRMLEQLALVMTIYQSNSITKDELMTFFNDIESGLKYYFFQHVSLDKLYKRSLLKNNNTYIEFENTEFREYLAAKEISRLGNVEQVVFDLAVNVNMKDIYPSWYNTIKFLIDIQPSLLAKVIQFGKIKHGEIKSHDYFKFLVNVQSDKISSNDKKEIFVTVFRYYQTQAHWIDYDILSALVNYFSRPLEPILKEYVESSNDWSDEYNTRVGNVLMLINELLEKDIDEIDLDYWKLKAIDLTNIEDDFVKGISIRVLGFFNDISLLQKVFSNNEDSSKSAWENVIDACVRINPNDIFSIQCIITGIRRGYWFSRSNLSLVTEPSGLEYLMNCLINDESFMIKFIEDESFEGKKDLIIINNIKKCWDKEIADLSEKLIDKALANRYVSIDRSQFMTELAIKLNKSTKENYLIKLLKKSSDNKLDWTDVCFLCAKIIKVKQVNSFIIKAREINKMEFAFQVLQTSRFFQNDSKNSVYEVGRKYFEDEYNKAEKDREKYEVNIEKKIHKLYEQFRYKLKPESGEYQRDVFKFVVDNQKELIPLIKENTNDLRQLCRLITNEIFEKIDIGMQEVNITERDISNKSISYSMDSSVDCFENAIRLAKILNINVNNYRQKIISFIPYTMNGGTLEDIFSLVPNPTDNEINMLLSIYNIPRNDDLPGLHPNNFIKAYKKYRLINATSIIKGFIEDDNIFVSDRINAINSIADNIDEQEYFEKLFLLYKDKQDEELQKLAEKCNEVLIEKYSNKVAILWRLDCIRKRAFELEQMNIVSNFRVISDKEVELSKKGFAAPLMKVKDEVFKDDYRRLLQHSFDLIKQNDKYRRYSYYIWDIVLKYFENLKVTGKSKHLLDLEKWVHDNSNKLEDINWFKYRIQEVRKIYLDETDKPVTIQQCIMQYNRLKHNVYLDIVCSRDLLELVQEIIDNDLKKWVELGAYKFIEDYPRRQEVMIQKTIKTQLENAILKRGIRDIGIIREPQLLNDIRPDFLISYGFVGSIVVEIKRVANSQVKNKKEREQYASKLVKYIEGTNSDYVVYLLFNTEKKDKLDKYLSEVHKCYEDEERIFVKGLDCIGNNNSEIVSDVEDTILK